MIKSSTDVQCCSSVFSLEKKMKALNRALVALTLFFGSMTTAMAIPFTGSISANGTATGSLIGTADWANGSTLSWNVSQGIDDLWTYTYHFQVPRKDISHIIFQVSDTFSSSNVKAGTTSGYDLDTFGTQGNSNPGIPSNLYGLKFPGFDVDDTFVIVSDRAPMWGSFYAKDGVSAGIDVYAYNASFGQTSNADIFGTAPFGFILVPDTVTVVPVPDEVSEPSTFLLLGAGLVGLGSMRRKKQIS